MKPKFLADDMYSFFKRTIIKHLMNLNCIPLWENEITSQYTLKETSSQTFVPRADVFGDAGLV